MAEKEKGPLIRSKQRRKRRKMGERSKKWCKEAKKGKIWRKMKKWTKIKADSR